MSKGAPPPPAAGSIAPLPYRCKHHLSSLHDCFISYRVASEAAVAGELFGELSSLKKPNGEEIKVYWDARCLNDAANWQEGFLNGLNGSRVIIILVSIVALQRFISAAPTSQDNLLLEWEAALELMDQGKASVFPILIGTSVPVESKIENVAKTESVEKYTGYYPFSTRHAATNLFPSVPHNKTGKNIQDTLKKIFQLQGSHYYPKGVHHLAKQLRDFLLNLEEINRHKLKEQVLKFLKIDVPGGYLPRITANELDLSNCNLQKAVLPFISLQHSTCVKADFAEAFLQGADFTGANLAEAIFTDADCSALWDQNGFKRTIIANVQLGTKFIRTKLSFVRMSNVYSSKFEKCNLSGAKLTGELRDVIFDGCEMAHIVFSHGKFSGEWKSDCSDSQFDYVYFVGGLFKTPTQSGPGKAATITKCSFVFCPMVELPGKVFVDCRFKSCTIKVKDVAGVSFTNCEFSDCKLSPNVTPLINKGNNTSVDCTDGSEVLAPLPPWVDAQTQAIHTEIRDLKF